MNDFIKQIIALIVVMMLFFVIGFSMIMLNPFWLLIGVFGLQIFWKNIDKFF